MRKTPILSICIPTFNRCNFLDACLKSIVSQFKNEYMHGMIEVIISDNASSDNTQRVVKKFQKKYKNIRYYRNNKNIKAQNLIKVGLYAKGKYIWFFSDDDLHYSDSIQSVIEVLRNHKPDAITCNTDLFSKDMTSLVDSNLLRMVGGDRIFKTKKELFHYLESKVSLPFDWYVGVMSNTIISRDLFKNNLPIIHKKFGNLEETLVFFYPSFIYYNPSNYKVFFFQKPQLKFRADNRSFGLSKKNTFLPYWHSVLGKHYDDICKINKRNVSLRFIFLIWLKKMTRISRVFFLNLFNFDIAHILMVLFYKDSKGKRKKWQISV